MASTLAMAMVLPPCNLISHLGLCSMNDFSSHARDGKCMESESQTCLRAVEATTSAPDGTPLLAVGCGSMIPILSPIDGAVGLSVVGFIRLLVKRRIVLRLGTKVLFNLYSHTFTRLLKNPRRARPTPNELSASTDPRPLAADLLSQP
jgi:hypothetical protein